MFVVVRGYKVHMTLEVEEDQREAAARAGQLPSQSQMEPGVQEEHLEHIVQTLATYLASLYSAPGLVEYGLGMLAEGLGELVRSQEQTLRDLSEKAIAESWKTRGGKSQASASPEGV